ncbi:TetR/AcrR family transcriptional regulator [Microbacterium sp. NPDC089696]|uniref:TetR/AcrR family transcriptional regulator n=1 Tax=Microbacterium sp. NPDC089696 TaxID=3364199 RepID=UPI0038108099
MAQYAKTAEVRRGIVDACLAIFGESGFHAASMAEIARRAGISHTGLVHHFPRKEDLLTAVLDLQDQRSAAYLEANAALSPEADPLTVLRGMAHALIGRDDRVGLVELSAVLTGEATSPAHPAHDYFSNRYRNIRSFVTRLFARLSEQGRLTTDAPAEHLAALLIAATDGLHTQWLYDREAIDVDARISELLSVLVRE